MKTQRKRITAFAGRYLGVLLLALLPHTATAVSDQLDQLFQQLAMHDWELSYDALEPLDKAVIQSTTDEDLRKELEKRFIGLLRQSENPFALRYTFKQLYLIGSPESVPAIEPWLEDPGLSHMARYAMANIHDPSVEMALENALGRTEGELKAGIIQSLADQKDPACLEEFSELLSDESDVVALASIRALGMTGNSEHLALLEEAGERSAEFYAAATDARLSITERMAGEGRTPEAGRIYRELYETGKTTNVRMAGLKGMMSTGDGKSENLLLEALGGEDPEIRGFAGRLIADPGYPVRVPTMTKGMKKLPSEGKIVLVEAFGHREAVEAKPAIMKYGDDPDKNLQLAVVEAIGGLGDKSDIGYLAGKAAVQDPELSHAAQVSLSRLEGEGIDAEILSQLRTSPPEVQAALITSLTVRESTGVKNEIAGYLDSPDAGVRKSALTYMRQNGDPADLQLMIDFIGNSGNRSELRLASMTLTAICTREGAGCEEAVLSNLDTSDPRLQSILLENLNLVNTPAALEQCIELCGSTKPDIRKTAVRTLAAWQDSTALDELKEIMNNSPDQSERILAFRGYFRLYKDIHETEQNKMREYGRLIAAAERKEEKILVLSAFSDIRSIDAMKRIEKYLYDEEMSHETCITLLKITDFLDSRYKPDIAIAMMQIMEVSNDENILADVERRFEKHGIEPSLYFDPRVKEGGAQMQAEDLPEKRVVFISGPMDHAWYGAHEYPKDLLFLKKCLENSPDIKSLKIEFYITPDKIDLEKIRGADAIVAHSSADRARGEVHSLFPNNREDMNYTSEEKEYFRELDKIVKSGMGVVTLHYSVWTDFPESREYMSSWVGGYYDDNVSKVRMAEAQVKIESADHPVNRGVSAWKLREEYYINQVYNKKGLKFTPLIAAELPLNRGDKPAFHTMGWAVERKDGGRGLGYTGCHSHAHLYHDDYRKFVVNAIAWTAGIPVPKGGIRTEIPEGWEAPVPNE